MLISNGDQDIDYAVRASVTLFSSSPFNDGAMFLVQILNNTYTYEVNFRSTMEFFGSDQSIDQDIDFRDRADIGLLRGVRVADRDVSLCKESQGVLYLVNDGTFNIFLMYCPVIKIRISISIRAFVTLF